ncbi:phage tail assembly chaperone [Phyllobacterium endophyticum]|uniref:phage tail assembly chaperone n=1 Tax=Phyllobacterium endophyticum TaxID=1149773 RepID=UPI003CCC74D2
MGFARAHFTPRRKNDPVPEAPEYTDYIWDWFVQLHNSRETGFSANPISFLEVEAFCRLTGALIDPWELSVIRRMDQAVLAIINKTGKHEPSESQATAADVQEAKLRIRGAATNRRVVERNKG